MSNNNARFEAAAPYQDDVLALPVSDLDQASDWYGKHFGMTEVERKESPVPTVIMERDGTQIGYAITGGDASQDGAAIKVTAIEQVRSEIEASGANVSDFKIDERDGKKLKVFFVVAPDGLCYYFHQPVSD